eukprot:jgi/Mesvir1/11567/Mv06709-RA.1
MVTGPEINLLVGDPEHHQESQPGDGGRRERGRVGGHGSGGGESAGEAFIGVMQRLAGQDEWRASFMGEGTWGGGDPQGFFAVLRSKVQEVLSKGDVERVRQILRLGVYISGTDYDGRTALHLAASAGNEDVVRALLEEGVALNVKDRWGTTALHDAAMAHEGVARLLHASGAVLECQGLPGVLMDAAARADVPLLRRFLDSGVDVNTPDYDGRTGQLSEVGRTVWAERLGLKEAQEMQDGQ